MYKLIFSDMDETFLDSDHKIPRANIRALARLREAGVLFVPCSGRPYASIMDNFADIDQSLMQGTYVVSLNGGFINRYGDAHPLTSVALDRKTAEERYRYGFEHGICMHINVPSGKIYTQHVSPQEHAYLSGLKGIIELDGTQTDLSFVGDEDIVKVLYVDYDFEHLQRLGDEIAPTLDPAKVEITYSSQRYLEFMPAGMNKGVGLRHLAEMLHVDIADTIAVGDAANDIEMIRAAGLGVGVANVTADVRPFCDVVLDTAGGDGAFEELVDRFIA